MQVYTLALQDDCYYVGTTTKDVKTRFKEHENGQGSAWTRLHPPIRVENVITYSGDWPRLEEDKRVCELMITHGMDNVRGGTYSKLKMNQQEVDALSQKLRHAENACLRCGRMGHFASACFANTNAQGIPLGDKKRQHSESIVERPAIRQRRNDGCTRCGRDGHTRSNCYARRTIDGDSIEHSDNYEILEESEDDDDSEGNHDTTGNNFEGSSSGSDEEVQGDEHSDDFEDNDSGDSEDYGSVESRAYF